LIFKQKTNNQLQIALQELDLRTPENRPLEIMTEIQEHAAVALPQAFMLNNYPNPFNGTTRIQLTVPQSGHVMMEIVNMLGQTVRTLVNDNREAGEYNMTWNCRDNADQPVSTGVYMLRVVSQNQSLSKKILYLR